MYVCRYVYNTVINNNTQWYKLYYIMAYITRPHLLTLLYLNVQHGTGPWTLCTVLYPLGWLSSLIPCVVGSVEFWERSHELLMFLDGAVSVRALLKQLYKCQLHQIRSGWVCTGSRIGMPFSLLNCSQKSHNGATEHTALCRASSVRFDPIYSMMTLIHLFTCSLNHMVDFFPCPPLCLYKPMPHYFDEPG